MMGPALFRTSFALAGLAFITGCAEFETAPTSVAPAPTPPQGYWNGDGVSGSPKIVVSISDQRAYFFKGKQLVGESTVSTGKPGFGTPPGYYTVFWKHADHVSTVFGDYVDDFGNVVKSNIDSRKDSKPPGSHYDGARMPFAMFFRGGYAMHQGYVPPYAASHGCIRLPAGMAEIFFNASPPGTPVIVKQESVMPPRPAPPVDVEPPPPPRIVRSNNPPAYVPPATVRTNVPAPTPIPVRSPAPMVLRAPATVPSPTPVRSLAPGPYRNPPTAPLRSPSPAPVILRGPATVPSPTPVLSPAPRTLRNVPPAPLRSPTPAPIRPTTSARSTVPVPAPTPVRSPAPASVRPQTTTSVNPTPTPTPKHSRKHRRLRSRTQLPSPAPTPTPAPRP